MQGRRARARCHAGATPSLLASPMVVIGIVLACTILSCERRPEVVIKTARGESIRIHVELALTPAQQERGLMYRQVLDQDSGMLFVFAESEIHSFWMKNTPLPLDMIFIDDEHEIVGIVEHAVPFTTTARMVGKASRYVLEVNAGFATNHNVKPGDHVDLPAISNGP